MEKVWNFSFGKVVIKQSEKTLLIHTKLSAEAFEQRYSQLMDTYLSKNAQEFLKKYLERSGNEVLVKNNDTLFDFIRFFGKMEEEERSGAPIISEAASDPQTTLGSEVEDALDELSNLGRQFTDIEPKLSSTDYLVAVRRFQNGMRVALLEGAETGNRQTFLEGLSFYKDAINLLRANNNSAKLQQCENELIQILLRIISKAKPYAGEQAPYGPFFLYISCQYLANTYESNGDFELAMKFHERAANFSKGIVKELELLQKMLDALLCNNQTIAQETLNALELKHFSAIGRLFSEAFAENNLQKVQNGRNLLETLGAQRNLPINQILSLTEKLIEAIQPKLRVKGDARIARQLSSIPTIIQPLKPLKTNEMTKTPKVIFISYAMVDSARLQIPQLATALARMEGIEEVQYWEGWNGYPNGNVIDFMEQNITKAQIFIPVFTPTSNASQNCKKERDMAIFQNKRIIPLFEDFAYVPPACQPYLGVNIKGKTIDQVLSEVYPKIIQIVFKKP